MVRVLPTPVAPPPPSGAQEFARPYEFQLTTGPRDLARALQQEKSHDTLSATKVLTPDEQ